MIKNLALEASAGSGKTYALSVRYISLLFLGVHPNEILTLTFTNKAALEMKKRIFETLKNLEYSSELNEICTTTNKNRDEILRLKSKIFKEFLQSDLKISTIDSFFSSILRKFSFNIGVMPDFQLEDSVVSDDKIERFLKICKSEMLYKSLILFALNEDKKLDDVFSLMSNLFEKHSEINFEKLAMKSAAYPKEEEILAIVKEMKQQFLKNGLGERGVNTLKITNVKNLLQKKFLQRNDLNYWSYNKYCNESINTLFRELKVKLYGFCRAKETYILSEIAKLYKAFTQALSVESKRNSTLSFLEMVNKLYDILRDDIARDFLYFRMDGNFNHLLVDEFQDTNIVQYKILEPFFQEIVSGVGIREKRSLFLVGDVKQSIYRFRGGAKEIFSYAVNSFGLERGILGTNHRSSSSIVGFVNDTFEDKIQDYKRQMTKTQSVRGFVGVYIDDELQKNLISQIEHLLNLGVKCDDIAVLCYTNKEALLLKEWIEDEIKDIHVTMEAKRKLIDIPMISAIIDFVCYLYFEDELYLENFQAISGKTYKKDDYLFDINENIDTLIIKIIRYFDIFSLEDDFLLFIEVCAKFKDIEDFLFNFQDISQNSISQENSAIRVLTIHKSKGLEFSNVFVVDRLKRPRSGGNTFIFDYVEIQLKEIYLNIKNREFFDDDYARAKEKEKLKECEDAINIQYVAFTRARDNLFILAKEKDSAFQNLELRKFQNGEIYIKKDEEPIKCKELICFMPKRFGVQESEKTQADKIKTDDFKSRDFGLALHYMLEMMGGFDKKYIQNAYESLCNRYKMILDIDDLEDIKKRVLKLLGDTWFLAIMKDAKIMKEQPIYYDGQRKQL
ncbi:MAG: RecB-like helicase, partial [Epsilonproteobacteria bacterium]|nr:RecB-like helicase [Campylobacterota bacterium]